MSNNMGHDVSGSLSVTDANLNVSAIVDGSLRGGSSALNWFVSETPVQNTKLTLRTDGTYDFGNHAQPRHWGMGSDIRQNGTASTDEVGKATPSLAVWGGVDTTTISTNNLRHSNIDQHYRSIGSGVCTWSKGFDASPASDTTFYLSFWAWCGSDFYRTYATKYTGLTGSFNTSAQFDRGESVTITYTDTSVHTGYITRVDTASGTVTFEIAGGTGGAAAINGALMSGDISGATLTISCPSGSGVDYASLAATKTCRIWQGDVTEYPFTKCTISPTSGGVIDLDYMDASGADIQDSASDVSPTDYTSKLPQQWNKFELELDFSAPFGKARVRVNDGTIYEATATQDLLSTLHGFQLANIGLDTPGIPFPYSDIGLMQDWGEIYADNSLYRWVLGDAATLDACTKLEIQHPDSWTNNEVVISINKGAHTDVLGNYLFLVGGNFSEIMSVHL